MKQAVPHETANDARRGPDQGRRHVLAHTFGQIQVCHPTSRTSAFTFLYLAAVGAKLKTECRWCFIGTIYYLFNAVNACSPVCILVCPFSPYPPRRSPTATAVGDVR